MKIIQGINYVLNWNIIQPGLAPQACTHSGQAYVLFQFSFPLSIHPLLLRFSISPFVSRLFLLTKNMGAKCQRSVFCVVDCQQQGDPFFDFLLLYVIFKSFFFFLVHLTLCVHCTSCINQTFIAPYFITRTLLSEEDIKTHFLLSRRP